MQPHSHFRKVLAILVASAVMAAPVPALASGFQLVEQNASGLGNAYAGQAAAVRDASAIYFNPANLTRIPGRQFLISVEPIGIGTTFEDSGSARPFFPTVPPTTIPVPLGGTGGEAGGWTPVPNTYVSWQAGSKTWLGFGVNIPFGLKTDWAGDWMGRFKAIESEVKTINLNPTIAFKLGESFSLGGGANYQRVSATLSQNVAYGGLAYGAALSAGGPAAAAGILAQLGGVTGLAREGTSTVDGDTWSWGWNVGLALQAGKEGHIGASYRSKIKHDVEGDVTFADAPAFATSGALGPLGAALNSRFASGPVTTQIELPETASIAASYEGETFEVLADWTWTGWSSIQELKIDRTDGSTLSTAPLNFEDTWRVGLGVNTKLNDKCWLRLGTAYDKAPVQDQYRTPRLPDQDRTWAAVGFQYKVGKSGAIDVGYAHLFIKDASSNLANQDTASSPPTGTLVGTYNASVNILAIQFRTGF